ncbi:MAG: LPS-assembly protein LptD [Alphaproteobacteria bacterium GM7ARS4]|nr:LPS-assembly protein LptD [Alphaproteobacteria bacterium GM7ARS4]
MKKAWYRDSGDGGRMGRYGLAVVMTLLGYGMAQGDVMANDGNEEQSDKLYISAESMTHLKEKGHVVAEGDVHIAYGDYVLTAQKVILMRKSDKVLAEGSVRLFFPSGDVMVSERAELSRDLSRGIVQAVQMVLRQKERVAAVSGVLTPDESRKIVMKRAGYTPCARCSLIGEFYAPPTWALYAETVEHDDRNQEIRYYHVTLTLFGFPVFYLPYYAHPDPRVKRRSGFLRPIFGRHSPLGVFIGMPYYFAPTPSLDATMTPIYYRLTGWLFQGEMRWNTPQGALLVEGAVTSAASFERTDQSRITRGYVHTRANFGITPHIRWGWDVYHTSDDTFSKLFRIGENLQVLKREIYGEGFFGNSYVEIRTMSFQDLRPSAKKAEQADVLPFFSYHYGSDRGTNGTSWAMDVESVRLDRNDREDKQRLSTELTLHQPFLLESGHRFDAKGFLRTDAYFFDWEDTETPNNKRTLFRFVPRASLRWRFPMVHVGDKVTYMIEPSWLLAVAPNGLRDDRITDDESIGFEWNPLALFEENHLIGSDVLESGKHVDYGVTFSQEGSDGLFYSDIFVGQSYRFDKSTDYELGSGLDDRLSYLLLGGKFSLLQRLTLSYDGILRPKGVDWRSHKVNSALSLGSIRITSSYSKIGERITALGRQRRSSRGGGREDMTHGISFPLGSAVNVRASINYDITEHQTLDYRFSFVHRPCDCLEWGVDFRRNFTRDRDYEPSDSINFIFKLKHLGGASVR